MADVVLNKIQTIQKCLSRIHEEYDGFEDVFKKKLHKTRLGNFKFRMNFSSFYRYSNTTKKNSQPLKRDERTKI